MFLLLISLWGKLQISASFNSRRVKRTQKETLSKGLWLIKVHKADPSTADEVS